LPFLNGVMSLESRTPADRVTLNPSAINADKHGPARRARLATKKGMNLVPTYLFF